MRAADGGWAARFSAFFVALSFPCFDRESTLQPTAANACRWVAARTNVKNKNNWQVSMAMTHDLLAKSYRLLLFDELEDYKQAIKMLTEYLAIQPQSGLAYNNRGLAHSEIGQGDEALIDFARAMECSPTDPIPYVNRGDLYLRAKPTARLQDAIDDFTHAITLNKNDATFHRRRAHACLVANQWPEAIESFSNAIELEPDFRQTYIDRGKTYQQIGEAEKAEHDFEKASRLSRYPTRR